MARKNQLFFDRSRPQNMAYIFGFRKHEQGNNAVEIPRFDPLVIAQEKEIAARRDLKLKPAPNVPVPEKPIRNPQPLPEFDTAEGVEISLFAENPSLAKPIQMNFDPQGRLWVATSEVYPQVKPGQVANDKIVVLQDTTGDGRADKTEIFAEGLFIPTAIEPGDGGVMSAKAPSCYISRTPMATVRPMKNGSCCPASGLKILITPCTPCAGGMMGGFTLTNPFTFAATWKHRTASCA